MREPPTLKTPRLPFIALALLALFFTGCTKTEPAASAGAGKKILNVGNGAEPQDLDPQITTGVTEHHILMALFEGLVAEHPSGEGLAPGVAESWETSADQLTWTFRLRADAKWSNGDPVTSRDFLRSFQRILTPALAAEYSYQLYLVEGAEAFNKGTLTDFAQTGFGAPDDRTVTLRLVQPVPYLPYVLRHTAWFPVHLPTIEKFGPADRKGSAWTRAGNLVGNGPFVLTKWQPNQAITTERSPTYWNAANVKLDAVVFHALEDVNTEERMFRAGQLDTTNTMPPDKIEVYRRDHPEMLRLDPYYGTYYFNLNVTSPRSTTCACAGRWPSPSTARPS
jgi:oligopeptide transport system substrate-binding protein